MPRHALCFRIIPGSEEKVAALLADYTAPALEIDANTRLLSTTVFLKETLVVRLIEIEGDLGLVARHLSADPTIQRVERELARYLQEPYDTTDPQARRSFFATRLMRKVTNREVEVVFSSVP